MQTSIPSAVEDPSCLRSFCACSRVLIWMVLWLLPVLCAARLQAQDTRNEFWPEFDAYLRLNEKSRLFFMYSATKLDQRATHADGTLGGHLDFYTLPLFGRRLLQHRADVARRDHPPGCDGRMPSENGMLSEMLLKTAIMRFCFGKWHLNPSEESTPAGRCHRWPLGRGLLRVSSAARPISGSPT
jgi:hypothetical protein